VSKHEILFDSEFHLNRFRNNINQLNRFHGRSVNTDRATLKALIFFAQQNGAYTVSPGLRKISEFTGHDIRTTSKSLWRLHHKGWITNKFMPSAFDGRAARWRINWDAPFLVDAVDCDSEILREHLLWSGYCLGAKTELVYRAIEQNQKIKKRQISKLTNLGVRAVDTSLKMLIDANLILSHSRRYETVIFKSVSDRQELISKIKEKYNLEWKQQEKIYKYESDRLFRNKLLLTSKIFNDARDKSMRAAWFSRSKTNPNATHKYQQ
jgi:hypothetical protein